MLFDDPLTGEAVTARRRRTARQYDLPMKDEYDRFVESFLAETPGDSLCF